MEERNDEIYITVKDYENYSVSNYGNVINKKTGKNKKSHINSRGFYVIDLFKNNIRKEIAIHSLVAIHFLDSSTINNKKHVKHIDKNKLNNYENNLIKNNLILKNKKN